MNAPAPEVQGLQEQATFFISFIFLFYTSVSKDRTCLPQKLDCLSYSTKPPPMRILLLVYVIVFLLLNFFIDHPFIFYLAMSTFPVSVYLLIRRSGKNRHKSSSPAKQPENLPTPKEDSF
jgi:hypothetical protein